MQKGILLEVEGRTGIVLTPSGEFRRVRLPAGELAVGDEIPVSETESRIRDRASGWVTAAAAVLLALLVGYWQWNLTRPAALVMIDINPSVQLTVNGRSQVIQAEGLNEDGREVLAEVVWRRQPVEDVAAAIAARAVALGKLNPVSESSAVVMAVAPVSDRELSDSLSQGIVERSRSALQAVVAAEAESLGVAPRTGVAVVSATAAEVEEARKQDLTLPRLIILEELQADYPEVTADAIRTASPGAFLQELGISPSEVFSRAEQRRSEAVPAAGSAGKGEATDPGRANPSNSGQGNPGRSEGGKDSGKGSGKGSEGNPDKGNQGNPGKGNLGNSGKGNEGNPDRGNPGNPGKGNPGNPDKGNQGNQGKGNPGNPGKGNPGNPGKGNQDNPDKGNQGNSAKGNQGKPGKVNEGNSDKGNPGNPGKGNPGNPDKGNPGNPVKGNEDNSDKGNQGSSGKANQGNPGRGNQGNSGKGNQDHGGKGSHDSPAPGSQNNSGKGPNQRNRGD